MNRTTISTKGEIVKALLLPIGALIIGTAASVLLIVTQQLVLITAVVIIFSIAVGLYFLRILYKSQALGTIEFDDRGIAFINFGKRRFISWEVMHSIQACKVNGEYQAYKIVYRDDEGDMQECYLPRREEIKRYVQEYYQSSKNKDTSEPKGE